MGAEPTVADASVQVRSASDGSGWYGEAGGETISVDQAVFTSVPSAAGTGYRIIAASRGIAPEERREITQRCPSHASLAGEGPSAEGLSAWPLRSGRYLVAWTRHAGLEHTGRGGQRVYTHAAVLDAAAFRRFEFHPVRAYCALIEALDEGPVLQSEAALGPLYLPVSNSDASTWRSALGIGCRQEAVFALLEACLAGKPVLVTGLSSPVDALDAVLGVLPLSLRPAVSLCTGLKYSPSRPARITVLEGDCQEARRLTRGQDVTWLDAAALTPAPPASRGRGPDESHANHRWVALVRRWWTDGRRAALSLLAAGIDFEATRGALDRIAAICEDGDAAARADAAGIEELAERYTRFVPANPVEVQLVKRLHAILDSRLIT